MMESLDEEFVIKQGSVIFTKGDANLQVLSGLDLSVAKGEWLGITGRNGSGKSTLGKVIAGFCPLASGRIDKGWMEGKRIGMIGQQPDAQIVGETIYEDVCFTMENDAEAPEHMPDIAERALNRVGLRLPFSHSVAELSGGQKQLLAIAGWLVTDVEMLIFDEATAMLDPESRLTVLQVAEELNRSGTTVVWITQWMEELAWADRVIALDNGELKFAGPTSTFFYGAGHPIGGHMECSNGNGNISGIGSGPDNGYGPGLDNEPNEGSCRECESFTGYEDERGNESCLERITGYEVAPGNGSDHEDITGYEDVPGNGSDDERSPDYRMGHWNGDGPGNKDQGRTTIELKDVLTPCQLLGYEQPYAVRVARLLQQRGICLCPLPVTVEQLSLAVSSYGSSA